MTVLRTLQRPLNIISVMPDTPVFKTVNEFSLYIEQTAADRNISCIEAVLEYCADHMLEPEDIASKISKSLKSKIEQDFRDMDYLPKLAQLDM
jgi:hypothetical protein